MWVISVSLIFLSICGGIEANSFRDNIVENDVPLGDLSAFSQQFEEMLRTWPRQNLYFEAAPSTFEPPYDLDTIGDEVLNIPYFQGFTWMVVAPVGIGVLCILCCLGFCLLRMNDGCGGKRTTNKFKKYQICCFRLFLLILFITVGFFTVLALVANAYISKSVDNLFVNADNVIEHIYGYKVLMVQAYNVALPGRDITGEMKDLLADIAPESDVDNFYSDHDTCLDDTYTALVPEGRVWDALALFLPFTAGRVASFDTLVTETDGLDSDLGAWNFDTVGEDFDFVVSALANGDTSAYLTALTGTVAPLLAGSFETFGSALSLVDTFTELNDLNITSSHAAALNEDYTSLNTALALLPAVFDNSVLVDSEQNQIDIAGFLMTLQLSLDNLPELDEILASLGSLETQIADVSSATEDGVATLAAYDAAVDNVDFGALSNTLNNLDTLLSDASTYLNGLSSGLNSVDAAPGRTLITLK